MLIGTTDTLLGTNQTDPSFITSCLWRGLDIPCFKIFRKVTTDHGICCSTTKIKIEDAFYETRFTKLISNLERKQKDSKCLIVLIYTRPRRKSNIIL